MRYAFKKTSYLRDNTDGNMSVMIAGALSVMSMVAAVAIDTSHNISVKSKMQNALDSATLYVGLNIGSKTHIEDGKYLFLENFSLADTLKNTSVTFEVFDDYVIGTARAVKPLFFGSVLKRESVDISASTTVMLDAETLNPPCIFALNPAAQPGILVNDGAVINTHDCEVHTASTANPAFTINAGVDWETESTCIAGRHILNYSDTNARKLETGCDVANDPYDGAFPIPDSSSCDHTTRNYRSARVSLSPGVYCGWHDFGNPNSTVTFSPGLYVIRNGGWNVNGGDWQGDGVTFYFADSSTIQFNSAAAADFTAPTSGPYKDVFMTEAPANPYSQFVLNDARGFKFEGIIYLPSRQVVFNSGANSELRAMNLVADSFIFNNAALNISQIDGGMRAAGAGAASASPYISN